MTGQVSDKSIDRVELEDGSVVTDPCVIAEEINDYLISVQSDRPSTVQTANLLPLQTTQQSFFIAPTTEDEIKLIVRSLKNKKSTGYDNISTKLLKFIIDDVAPVLTFIVNNSFSQGIFPENLKLSSVVPILKSKASFKLDNIRPISLLSIFSKIFEKLMVVRLHRYLNKINFLSINQFGFLKGKSTEDALLNVTENIYNSLNSSCKTTGLFIDFKKAFDLVDHEILLCKLEAVGIRGVALCWFRSFLVDRQQKVKILGNFSPPKVVESGVPQGSVTAAVLFLIFLNDLLELNFHGKVSAFADDIALFYSNKDTFRLGELINHDLLLLRQWCLQNKMQVNVNKTKFVNFDILGFEIPFPLTYHSALCNLTTCHCQPLERVNHFKYLGIVLDERMNFEKHIIGLNKKLKSSIRTFYFLRNFCNVNLLRSLSHTAQIRLIYVSETLLCNTGYVSDMFQYLSDTSLIRI